MFTGNSTAESTTTAPNKDSKRPKIVNGVTKGRPMTVLYGSNSGTCEGLAQALASDAANHGFNAVVKPLDAAVGAFPSDHPVIIITASYEGDAPDNARQFLEWLKSANSEALAKSRFAIFGCGHRDWVATYQRVPKTIEAELLRKSATAIAPRGETDVAAGTIFDNFDDWIDIVWSALDRRGSTHEVEGLDMDISTSSRAIHLRHQLQSALVLKNDVVTKGDPEKRHVELGLPAGLSYEAGDYIALLPMNNIPTISRVLRRFGLPWDAMMTLKKGTHTTIPTEKELSVATVLGAYVELGGAPTKKNIATLAKHTQGELDLSTMAHLPLLDILERYTQIDLPFHVFLSMLPPMRIRQYSVASSPLHDPTTAGIVFTVVASDGYLGVATNYMRHLEPGNTVLVTVKKSHASFHLPADLSIPIIMVAAGTGIAPFCGFVQELAYMKASGKTLAEAILFVGCRSPAEDQLFGEQFAAWEAAGVVKVYYAYSRNPEKSNGCRYAQERLWHERSTVNRLFKAGAKAYICGSAGLGKGVSDAAAKIAMDSEKQEGKELSYEDGLKWWESLRGERYAVDVFD